MAKRVKLTKLQKLAKSADQIIESYNNGTSLDTIAAWHKVSKGTVRKLLIAYQIELRGRGRPKGSTKNKGD